MSEAYRGLPRVTAWKDALTKLIRTGNMGDVLTLANELADSEGMHDKVAEFLFQAGVKLGKEDRHDDALFVFEIAARLAKSEAIKGASLMNCSFAHSALGIAAGKEGKYDDSESHFREALRLCPALSIAHSQYGYLLYLQGKYDESEGHFKQALDLESGDANTRINYAQLLSKLGRMEEAARQYELVLRSDPTNSLYYVLYGRALMDCNRFNEAELYVKKALGIAPNLISANFLQGKLLLRLKRFSEAKRYLRKTLDIQPDFADAATSYDYAVLMGLSVDPTRRITKDWLDARQRHFECERPKDLKDFELQAKHQKEWRILYDRFECLRCGRCCRDTRWAANIDQRLAWEDVERWRKERRDDILKYVYVFEGLGGDIFDKGKYEALSRCPFLQSQGRVYSCSIHETKPLVCQVAPFYFNNQGICENCGAPVGQDDACCKSCHYFLKVSPMAYDCPGMRKTLKSLGLLEGVHRSSRNLPNLGAQKGMRQGSKRID